MSLDAKTTTPEQSVKIAEELSRRGLKFLPKQALRRVVEDPKGLSVLGSTRRRKAARLASRELAAKQAALAAAKK